LAQEEATALADRILDMMSFTSHAQCDVPMR
jgi:hypothetical protein